MSIPELSIDFESRSLVNLKDTSVYPYAAHESTAIWCMAWAFEGEEPVIWCPTYKYLFDGRGDEPWPLPDRIVEHILMAGMIRAWNANFEREMWRQIMVKRHNAPNVLDEQWVCTAAEAAAMALPRALGNAAEVLGVPAQKDDEGYNLMMRMARPRSKPGSKKGLQWWDGPDSADKHKRLHSYCIQDVRTEGSAKMALRRLTDNERRIYLLDCRINDRGVPFDIPLVDAAQAIVDIGQAKANAQLSELTGGAVTSIKNHADLTDWLVGQGVTTDDGEPVDSVAKPAVAALLEGDLPEHVRDTLELRADAGRSSLAKLKTMKLVVKDDGRARGLHLYHAASTGRWGGKHIQTQNFARGTVAKVESFIPAVMRRAYDEIDLVEHPLVVIMSLLRSMIAAPDGYDLIAGDYSAVEARVLNWLAGQEDVVELFRAMDRGDKTKHPYKVMAVKMGRAASPDLVKKPSEDYQAGKAAELGCGYQMGAEKFVRAAWEVYQVRVTDEQAVVAVKAYRESHPMVVELWWNTERAVKQAIATPGVPFEFANGKLKAIVAGSYLYIVLPSRRPLVYAAPKVYDSETSWGAIKPTIHYWGVDPNPLSRGRWAQLRTYGGHLVENIVQAVARDLLAEAMLRLEAKSYLPIMHVHDEAVCEVPIGFGSQQEFEAIMSELPAWATGCPISAESWRGKRYRK